MPSLEAILVMLRSLHIAARTSLCLAVACVSSFASAQPANGPKPEATATFDAARALMEKGRYAEACPMLEKVQALDAGIGISFNLADCYEHIGRVASAWTGFHDAAEAADVAAQSKRAQEARARAAALVPKLSFLRIIVSAEAASTPRLDVQREGISVGRLLWGKSVPVDPGQYVVSATAPGREAFSTTVLVSKPAEIFSVEIPALNQVRADSLAAEASRAGALSPKDPDRTSIRTAVVLGSAIVSLVALEMGIGFTVAANGQAADVRALRNTLGGASACYGTPDAGVDGRCKALMGMGEAWDTFENAAIAGYVVSAFTAGGAIATYVWWPTRAGKRGAFMLPWMTERAAGAFVMGRF